MTQYPVVLTKEEDGKYSVFAPDLPGCQSWGNTREEAIDHIREAIELWIEDAIEEGEEVPKPGTSLHYIEIAS